MSFRETRAIPLYEAVAELQGVHPLVQEHGMAVVVYHRDSTQVEHSSSPYIETYYMPLMPCEASKPTIRLWRRTRGHLKCTTKIGKSSYFYDKYIAKLTCLMYTCRRVQSFINSPCYRWMLLKCV